jgi:hypothetical protein
MCESVLTFQRLKCTLAAGFDHDPKTMNSNFSLPGWTLDSASQVRAARSPANGCSAALLVAQNLIG